MSAISLRGRNYVEIQEDRTGCGHGWAVVFDRYGSRSGRQILADRLGIRLARGRDFGDQTASVTKQQATAHGIDLKFADAQQKQENQIKAIRDFIAQGVDAILVAPVVATGWDAVLGEAKDAGIPVILLDRGVDGSQDLYLTSVASDQVHEGAVAGQFLIDAIKDKPCKVVEIEGTVGSTPAINRKKAFDDLVTKTTNITIIRSQTGEFTRSKGNEVMEGFIKAENGSKDMCAVYAHNDDMMVGAIQAMKDAGLNPGKDIITISIDGVPDIFPAMVNGEANGTVELTPNMAGLAFDALEAFKKDGTKPAKFIITESKLYTPKDDPQAEYDRRKGLGY